MKRELRWKKGQESNTEKTEESDTQDGKGSASQENKTRYQSRKQEVENVLEELNFFGKTSTCDCTFMCVCAYRECNIYTVTHLSDFASWDCSMFDIYTRTLTVYMKYSYKVVTLVLTETKRQ